MKKDHLLIRKNDALEYILKYSSILGQPKDIKIGRERKLVLFKGMLERDLLSHVGSDFNRESTIHRLYG